ncbi:predicted protein [Sparassis crispa]|uniref:Fungal-type protein kinase domain-containing protein n=1 Tax=Sparassis crispa TaxID=139825 RepID=A0A401GQZ0_9APHY|nr:predicted protein [Sparassis crispa]GBE84635.1 predicted protein [Sparassis crispa]
MRTALNGFAPKNAEERYLRYAEEARKFFLGPMPVDDFLDFLPKADMSGMPRPRNAFDALPRKPKRESEIYTPLIAALNGGLDPRCPGFTFTDTSTRSINQGKVGSMKPDVCCYASDVLNSVHKHPKTGKHVADLGYTDLFFELKRRKDPPIVRLRSHHQFILNIKNKTTLRQATEALGQNTAHATEAMARQHRSFYFSISLARTSARIIRWDRGGAIASEAFDLHQHPEPLCEFLWRYAHASESQRGYDPTVECATPDEEDLFRTAIERHVQIQLGLQAGDSLKKAVEEHYEPGIVAAIHIVDEGSENTVHRLLVSRPVVSPLSMASRATRGYWAVSADGSSRGEVLFLKDTWRYDAERLTKEGQILADLRGCGVQNIPLLAYHGDVPAQFLPGAGTKHRGDEDKVVDQTITGHRNEAEDNQIDVQRTQTDVHQKAWWVCLGDQPEIHLFPHVHYRLVLGTVGYGLQRFEGAEELLHGTYDAYEAMMGAFTIKDEAKSRYHRDVSIGNIILHRDPNSASNTRHGYLIDWELSSLVNDPNGPRNYHKTGTLQFMSQRMLQTKNMGPHTFQDDMESVMYVVLYCSLRWLPHNLSPNALLHIIQKMFENHWIHGENYLLGGEGKMTNHMNRIHTAEVTFATAGIQVWLDTVLTFCGDYVLDKQTESANIWRHPEEFAKFWKRFLQSHMLPSDNRHNHIVLHAPHDGNDDSQPYPATRSASHVSNLKVASRQTSATPDKINIDWQKESDSVLPQSGFYAQDSTAFTSRTKRRATGEAAGATSRAKRRSTMLNFVARSSIASPVSFDQQQAAESEALPPNEFITGSSTSVSNTVGEPSNAKIPQATRIAGMPSPGMFHTERAITASYIGQQPAVAGSSNTQRSQSSSGRQIHGRQKNKRSFRQGSREDDSRSNR